MRDRLADRFPDIAPQLNEWGQASTRPDRY
eukprot:COSAG06_NODE_36763_length_443_cov_0.729651_1_plen_29_part_10